MLAVLTRSAPFAVGILAFARAATATVAVTRFGIGPFSVVFALEACVLGAAAFVLARAPAPRGRRALAGAFATVGILHMVPALLSLRRGVTFLTVGDLLFIAGLLGTAWALLHASTAARASAPAPAVAGHLVVAASGPLLWTLTNLSMGRLDFAATSALALAGTGLAAWAFARHDVARPAQDATAVSRGTQPEAEAASAPSQA